MRLILTMEQATQIIDHARAERPNEACGLLGGRESRVEEIYALPNIEKSAVRYLAEPQAQVDAMLDMEERDLEIVGIYHSHLDAAAYPSATDVAMSAYPDAVYLIVSLRREGRPVLGAFRIQDGEIMEVDVAIERSKLIRGQGEDVSGLTDGQILRR